MAVRPKIPGTQFARPAIVVRSETVAAWKSLAFTAGLVALSGTALAFLSVHISPFPPIGSGSITGISSYPGMADETVETDNPDATPFDLAPRHPNPSVSLPLPIPLRLPAAAEPLGIPSIPETAPELADTYSALLSEKETDPFDNKTVQPAPQAALPSLTKKTARPARTASSARLASRHANAPLAHTDTIYGSDELDEQVRYKNTPMMPSLPPHLKTPNSARVRITVSGSGSPVSVTILQSCGNPEVDSLLKHHILSHWTFHPAHRDGKPVATNVTTSLNFS